MFDHILFVRKIALLNIFIVERKVCVTHFINAAL